MNDIRDAFQKAGYPVRNVNPTEFREIQPIDKGDREVRVNKKTGEPREPFARHLPQ